MKGDTQEIELKLGVDARTLGRLARRLQQLTGAAGAAERLVATYRDDAALTLRQRGMALRVRSEAAGHVQALKRERHASGGLQCLREQQWPLGSRQPDLALLPPGVLKGVGPLAVQVETRVSRRHWLVPFPPGVVEVALDRGLARAGGRQAAIAEVELELKGGSPEALFALAAHLLAAEAVRADLPSKAEQGFRLLEEQAPEALGSKPARGAAGVPAGDAFAAALAPLAAAIAATLYAVLTETASEGPHQLRVALRRLRVLLRLHRPLLAPGLAAELADGARTLGRIVSPLRDADVLAPQLADTGPVADALAAWHLSQRARTRRQLRDAGATAFALRLLGLSSLGGWRHEGAARAAAIPIEAAGAARLERMWRQTARAGDRLAMLDDEAQHGYRKALKKLRYTLELVPPAADAKAWMSALKKLQESLGLLNDMAVLEGFDPPLPVDALPAFAAARARLLKAERQRSDAALGRAVRHWRRLRGLPLPWAAAN